MNRRLFGSFLFFLILLSMKGLLVLLQELKIRKALYHHVLELPIPYHELIIKGSSPTHSHRMLIFFNCSGDDFSAMHDYLTYQHFFRFLPIYNIPPGINIFISSVLILQIICMFPKIQT